MQEFKPELGPLSRRVETTFLEGIYSENVNLAETDYWFTEPEGSSGLRDTLHTIRVRMIRSLLSSSTLSSRLLTGTHTFLDKDTAQA